MRRFFQHLAFVSFAAVISVASIEVAGAWGQVPGGMTPPSSPACFDCGVRPGALSGLPHTIPHHRHRAAIGTVIVPDEIDVVQPYVPNLGMAVATLPSGCTDMTVYGTEYFQCGSTWYQPFTGANGIYYVVVPAP